MRQLFVCRSCWHAIVGTVFEQAATEATESARANAKGDCLQVFLRFLCALLFQKTIIIRATVTKPASLFEQEVTEATESARANAKSLLFKKTIFIPGDRNKRGRAARNRGLRRCVLALRLRAAERELTCLASLS